MDTVAKTIQSNALASLAARAPAGVVNAIKQASVRTGVNFAYLMQQAAVESNFKPQVKAKSSSATGLYQFIESTWLSMVKKYGSQHGLDTKGKSRSEILALRKDPKVSSLMAAEFASENEKSLNANWGGNVGATELYLAHFLGAGQASSFLNARDENPMQKAALIFPQAASANRNVFYDTKTGRAKTLDEIYAFFDRKFEIEDQAPVIAETAQEALPVKTSQVHTTENYNSLYYPAVFPSSIVRKSFYNYQLVSSPAQVMLMAQLEPPATTGNEDRKNNSLSLFSKARSYNE